MKASTHIPNRGYKVNVEISCPHIPTNEKVVEILNITLSNDIMHLFSYITDILLTVYLPVGDRFIKMRMILLDLRFAHTPSL